MSAPDYRVGSALNSIAIQLKEANSQKRIENIIRLGELYKSMGSNGADFALEAKNLLNIPRK